MNPRNLITAEEDGRTLSMLLDHIETPMRTLVALEFVACDTLETTAAQEVVKASMEEGVVDLVTSALAIITASWEQAGADLDIGNETDPDPEVDQWCSSILDRALVLSKLKWLALRVDYALNVGPIPSKKGH